MIDADRLRDLLLDLVRISSPSRREPEVADRPAERDRTAHMRHCFEEAARRHETWVGNTAYLARVEAEIHRDYDRLNLGPDARIVRLVTEAAARLGRECRPRPTGGVVHLNAER